MEGIDNTDLEIIWSSSISDFGSAYLHNVNIANIDFLSDPKSIDFLYLSDIPSFSGFDSFVGVTEINHVSITNCGISDFSDFSSVKSINGIELNNLIVAEALNLDFALFVVGYSGYTTSHPRLD